MNQSDFDNIKASATVRTRTMGNWIVRGHSEGGQKLSCYRSCEGMTRDFGPEDIICASPMEKAAAAAELADAGLGLLTWITQHYPEKTDLPAVVKLREALDLAGVL